MLHITSQEVASFASDLEKLLAEDPYVRVIRVVQQNTTLADGKVSCELISFYLFCFISVSFHFSLRSCFSVSLFVFVSCFLSFFLFKCST